MTATRGGPRGIGAHQFQSGTRWGGRPENGVQCGFFEIFELELEKARQFGPGEVDGFFPETPSVLLYLSCRH
jgi:hypothetical protein